MNDLERIVKALTIGGDEIHVDPELGRQAMKPLQRMLNFKKHVSD